MTLGLGHSCCGGNCHCLTYQDGNYAFDTHVRFDSHAFGVHLGCARQADLRLWKGWAGDTPSFGRTLLVGVRVPDAGSERPRVLCCVDQPNALVWEDFEALDGRQGVILECRDSLHIDCRSVLSGQTVTVRGRTFTAVPSLTSTSDRQFAIGGTDAQCAEQLAVCLSDPTYGLPGVSVAAADGRVTITPGTVESLAAEASVHQIDVQEAPWTTTFLTLTSVAAGGKVTINGVQFTAHAATTTEASREFSVAGTDAEDAAELAACINDPAYGVPDVEAVVASNAIVLVPTDGEDVVTANATTGQIAVTTATRTFTVDLTDVLDEDTIVVNSTTFTAASATTPSAHEFDVSGDDDAAAAELADCINDAAHGVADVLATVAGNRVTLTPMNKTQTITLAVERHRIEVRTARWTVLDSADFTYLGKSVLASLAGVDGIAAVLPIGFSTTTYPPDAAWCNPSYIPDSITLLFDNWENETTGGVGVRRANFNRQAMTLPLTATITSGSRRIYNYGSFVIPLTPFYSDAAIICAGAAAYQAHTIRWRVRCQVIAPVDPSDGTATQITVYIVEDWASTPDAGTGCYTVFSGDFGVPQYTGHFMYLSSFDHVPDDEIGVAHWIKKGDTAVSSSIGFANGVTYWNTTVNFNTLYPAMGDLVRIVM